MDVTSVVSSSEREDLDVEYHQKCEPLLADSLQKTLDALETEKSELFQQLQCLVEDHARQQEHLITRYINADFLLSCCETMLSVKRTPSRHTVTCPSSGQSFTSENPLALRHFLEPVSNLVYEKLNASVKEAQSRVRQSNDDLFAWKFDPESASGKRLMSRVRQLLNENERLGRATHAERIAVLEADAESQKTCIKEFKKTHEGIEGVLEEVYTDLEGLQNNLLTVHQQVNEIETAINVMQVELENRNPGRVSELLKELYSSIVQQPEEFTLQLDDPERCNPPNDA
ncbi:unnamed protein product [Dicrocoelium dendriticum]|nr:unnamed protein product [Dicrocoelium dendriticum]